MELTINIKDKKNIASFLDIIREFDYVEVADIKEYNTEIPEEHGALLTERLKRIQEGKTSFKNWDLIKGKYEGKAV